MTSTTTTPLALEVASCTAVGGRTHVDGTVWALPFGLQVAALWSAEDLAWEVLLLDPVEESATRMALVDDRERAEVIARASWTAGLGVAADAAMESCGCSCRMCLNGQHDECYVQPH